MEKKLKLPGLTLVTGGAASGKSAFAEALAVKSGLSRAYLATSQAFDAEMQAKIANHVSMRGPDWQTIEAPTDIAVGFSQVPVGSVTLLDCATMWLTNITLAQTPIETALEGFLTALSKAPGPVVVVTNELGQGIVPDNKMARQFRNDHGAMNQRLAAQADWVFGVMSGLPFALKGPDPRDFL